MENISQTEQIYQNFQVIKDIVLPVATALIGSITTGFATFKGLSWRVKREEKRNLILEISNSILDLHTTTISNFSPLVLLPNKEKALCEVSLSYESNFKKVGGLLVLFPNDVRSKLEEYFKLTHHNILVWSGKIRKNPDYIDDPLNPFFDQSNGKAQKAYDMAVEALSELSDKQNYGIIKSIRKSLRSENGNRKENPKRKV